MILSKCCNAWFWGKWKPFLDLRVFNCFAFEHSRIPFYIGKRTKIEGGIPIDEKNLTIDIDHPSVNKDSGNRIFLEHGSNSDYLNHISRVLLQLMKALRVKWILNVIIIIKLFEPLNLSVDIRNNNFAIKVLDNKWNKLKNLDEKSIAKLHQKGFLQHIYMIAASIGNMNNLIHLKKNKGA